MMANTQSFAKTLDGAISRIVQGIAARPLHLSAEVDRFRIARETTLGILSPLTPGQAAWTVRKDAWSIAQIADHLLRSEELYRGQFRKLIELGRDGKSHTIYVSAREVDTSLALVPREVVPFFEIPMRMFNMFVPHVLRETMVRFPLVSALNPRVSEPRAGLTVQQLTRDLTASLNETEELFRDPLPVMPESLSIDHPIMGNNNILQMLSIMAAHEERHHAQMRGVRDNANFPRVAAIA
jgi:hypothetical protein